MSVGCSPTANVIAGGVAFRPNLGLDATGVTPVEDGLVLPNAVLTASAAKLSYPFYSHGGIIGSDKASARAVGRLLTAGAYAPSSDTPDTLCAIAMDLATSIQLKRDSKMAERIYSYVQPRITSDICVSEIEQRFRFQWREVDVADEHGHMRRLDPYFAQHITTSIAESFRHLLFSLPHRLAALPGLNPSQSIESLTSQLNHACNVFYNELGPLLAGTVPHATHDQLLAKTYECAKTLTQLHTEPMRQMIVMQLGALRVLQRICSAVLSNEPIADILFQNDDILQVMANNPPYQLVEELTAHRVPFSEVAEFLTSASRQGIRGASQLPPNGAARELAVQRWVKRYGETVLQCMVPVRQALNVLSTSSDCAPTWHGVLVADKHAMVVGVAMQTGGSTASVQCTPAHHLHALNNLMLVATSTSDPTALLIPRLARVVTQLVEDGHITVRKVKADLLLPLICRWDCAATIEREKLLATSLSPLFQETGTEYHEDGMSEEKSDDDSVEGGDGANDVGGSNSNAPSVRKPTAFPAASANNETPLDRFGPCIESGTVPLSLERDHAIVVCARDLLRERQGAASDSNAIVVLAVKTVVSRVLHRAYDSLKASERSTTQSVGWVYNKIAQNFVSAGLDILYYKTDRPWPYTHIMSKPKGAGLVLTQQGAGDVLAHLEWIVDEMRNNGTAFAKAWFPSRSARSHSRRSLWQRRNGASAGSASCGDTGATEAMADDVGE